tara:strand:- start:1505 stop:1651 length:147 start_codon:yes stop_codon:yes gene_type:complete
MRVYLAVNRVQKRTVVAYSEKRIREFKNNSAKYLGEKWDGPYKARLIR